MKTCTKSTINAILAHKEYFDQKLIDIVQELRDENKKLVNSLNIKQTQIKHLNHTITGLKTKNEIILSENNYLKLAKKQSDITAEEIKKELERMQQELNRLYIENEKAIEEVKKQKKIQDDLIKKISKLERANSTNSNMPSSMDILSHTIPKERKSCNSRIKSNRNRGGQKGHKAHLLQTSTKVDEIKKVYVKKAPVGAEAVRDENGKVLYYRTQEIDITIQSKTIETRYYISEKGKEITKEEKQKYKINPVTYSTHFKSIMIYLNQRGTIPYERLSEIIEEISNKEIKIQPSTMVKWSNEFREKSEERAKEILKNITSGKIVNVDETGVKIDGKQNWIHGITNKSGTYFVVTEKRNDKEKGPIGLLSDYDKILVHDHFKPYYTLNKCHHSECNAHIERYLQEGIDFEKSEACKEVKEILQKSLQKKHELIEQGTYEMDKSEIETVKSSLLKIMEMELERYGKANPDISKKLEADYIKLFRRMREYIEEHLLFLRDFDVPYTNNAAEKCCRKVKTKKNISYQFMSKAGADNYARAMTIIETARLNKENVVSAIENIMK